MRRLLIISTSILFALILLQAGWVAWIMHLRQTPYQCKGQGPSLFVVFGGDNVRPTFALQLEKRCVFNYFCISDSSENEVRAVFKQWGSLQQARLLIEPEARAPPRTPDK